MEIRGRQYQAAQGIVTHTAGTDTTEVIAGVTGKTLFLNYVIISVSDIQASQSFTLTDGDAGTAFFFEELGSATHWGAGTSKSLNFGEYGLALTEGNGLWVESSAATLDITVTALGYFK